MTQAKSILEILLVVFLFGACSPTTPVTSVAGVVPTQTLPITSTSLPISSPTATTIPDPWETSKRCVTEYPKQSDNFQLEGVVVLRSLSSTHVGLQLSLQNLKDGSSKIIDTANQPVWDVDVSPDRQTLAYSWFNKATSKWQLILVDSMGHPQGVAWYSSQIFGFQGWINNKQLIIGQHAKYIVINPHQNSHVSYSPQDFPEFNLYHSDFYVSFDPLLSKVIYRDGTIDVLDLKSKTFITQIEDGYDRTPIVSWQPSGEEVAIVSSIRTKSHDTPDEIFILQKDGQVKQLTHLYDTFGLSRNIDSLSWSPDGSKIAFWLHDKEGDTTLMVTDSTRGNAVNHCVLNDFEASYNPIRVSQPIWSPDGRYLLVESRYTTDKNKVLIVDLSTNSAFPIAENASPVGWMIEKP